VLQLFFEEMVDSFRTEQLFQLFRPLNPPGPYRSAGVTQDEIDCLQRACGLLRKDDTEIGDVLLGILDCRIALVPHQAPGSNDCDADEHCRDEREATAGQKTPFGSRYGTHRWRRPLREATG
jgi:hypothetical protein